MNRSLLRGSSLVVGLLLSTLAHGKELAKLPELPVVRQLLQRHCVQCHGGEETYAGVNLSVLNSELDVWQNRAVWARAQLMIEEREMPPEDGEPLPDRQRESLSQWMQHTLDHVDFERIPRDPGFVPPRRFTGREYNYTVQDLFGLDGPVFQFPDDLVIGDSFENSTDSLNFESLWLEKALEAANATVRAVWASPPALDRLLILRPSPPLVEDESQFIADPAQSALCRTDADFAVVAEFIGFPERIFLRSRPGVGRILGSKELGFDDEALVYRVSQRRGLRSTELPIDDGQPHRVGLSVRDGVAAIFLDGHLIARRSGFARVDVPDHVLKIGFQEEEDEREEDEEHEDEEHEDEEHEDEEHEDEEDRVEVFQFFDGALADDELARLTSRPLSNQAQAATFAWQAGMLSTAEENFVTVKEATTVVVRDFLTRAFRREPPPETMERYTGLVHDGLQAGLTFELAMQRPVATALSSPAFLFVGDWDTAPDGDHAQALSPVDLANRLSYFLWSSSPDEVLREVALDGRLADPAELLRQTDRMLANPRAARFYRSFMLQWLRTQGLGNTIRPSRERFPDITDSLLKAMRQEGPAFFAHTVEHDHSLLEMIDAPYSLVNAELAAHYGFARMDGDDWRRVDHNDPNRGGVLTQAAVLTVSSSPQRTSPVFRGKWLLEVLLGDPPPPPPANVPPLPETEEATASSLRESLELHRRQAACAGCHSRIDPYGLALEQYDAVGALRAQLQDTQATLPGGDVVEDALGLKRHLVTARKDDFLRHVTRKMLAYALGRELTFSDERTVHEILLQLEEQEFGARALIHQVVLSEPFRMRNFATLEAHADRIPLKQQTEGP